MLEEVLQLAGPLFFIALQCSSISTALRIRQDNSVGKLSFLPFVSLLTNSIIWSFYGVLKSDNTVLFPNLSGAIAGLFCCVYYLNYSTSSNSTILCCSGAIIVFSYYLFSAEDATTLGSMGCLLSVILMGSPLAALATVLRDKSTESMPFYTSFMTWCNAVSWSMYGIFVAKDIMIYGPNLIGLALGSLQLSLFICFSSKVVSLPIVIGKGDRDIRTHY